MKAKWNLFLSSLDFQLTIKNGADPSVQFSAEHF